MTKGKLARLGVIALLAAFVLTSVLAFTSSHASAGPTPQYVALDGDRIISPSQGVSDANFGDFLQVNLTPGRWEVTAHAIVGRGEGGATFVASIGRIGIGDDRRFSQVSTHDGGELTTIEITTVVDVVAHYPYTGTPTYDVYTLAITSPQGGKVKMRPNQGSVSYGVGTYIVAVPLP